MRLGATPGGVVPKVPQQQAKTGLSLLKWESEMDPRADLYRNQTGSFNYVTAILLVFAIVVGAVVYSLGPGYTKNSKLAHYADGQAIRAAELSDFQINGNIMQEAKKLGVPTETLQIEVGRFNDEMTINYTFMWPIGLPGFGDKSITMKKTIKRKFGDVMSLE
jgi:hypothetical protein